MIEYGEPSAEMKVRIQKYRERKKNREPKDVFIAPNGKHLQQGLEWLDDMEPPMEGVEGLELEVELPLTMDEYQAAALKTAKFANRDVGIICCLLGLGGEVGEVQEKAKKHIRKMSQVSMQDSDVEALAEQLKKELGDVLWYIATLANHLGLTLSDIGNANLEKLASRNERGVIFGQGDER